MTAENVHKNHRKRMREEFTKNGFAGWQPHRVMEYLLFYVIPVKDTNVMAHNLINKFGSVVNVINAPKEKLMEVEGIGEQAAIYINMLSEFMRYYNKLRYHTDTFVLNSETCVEYLLNLFDGKKREYFYMISLDAKDRIISEDLIFEGGFESVTMDVDKIIRIAVKTDASCVVLAHNHPSGIAKPSNADIVATQALARALHMVNVRILDHVIVADGMCESMSDYLGGMENINKTDIKRRGA